eukprot:m.109886 g.109886  ORF g.109886 m.109886 type:complete len:239 (-) comp14018_c0_seq4:2342-3058(-)
METNLTNDESMTLLDDMEQVMDTLKIALVVRDKDIVELQESLSRCQQQAREEIETASNRCEVLEKEIKKERKRRLTQRTAHVRETELLQLKIEKLTADFNTYKLKAEDKINRSDTRLKQRQDKLNNSTQLQKEVVQLRKQLLAANGNSKKDASENEYENIIKILREELSVARLDLEQRQVDEDRLKQVEDDLAEVQIESSLKDDKIRKLQEQLDSRRKWKENKMIEKQAAKEKRNTWR